MELLVSPTGTAHIPGLCNHTSDDRTNWGTITIEEAWQYLGAGCIVQTRDTNGRMFKAKARCKHCVQQKELRDKASKALKEMG